MNQRTKGGVMSRLSTLTKATVIGITCSLFAAPSVQAQPGANRHLNLYAFSFLPLTDGTEEVHNYCTEVIPGGPGTPNDESVMAGNAWYKVNMPTWKVGHFFRVDQNGNIVSGSERYYYDLNYFEAHVQDIAVNTDIPSESYITQWVRPVTHNHYDQPDGSTYYPSTMHGYKDRDGIKVLHIDNNDGHIIDEATFFDAQPMPTGFHYGNSFYPISSMYHDGKLYICGSYIRYGVPDGMYSITNDGHHPLFSDMGKAAFIMSVDLSGPQMALDNIMLFDYVPTTNLNRVDYDMGMRMAVLDDGNIMMTGSVNELGGTYNPGYVRSATMAIVVTPDLNTMVADPNFINVGNMDGFGYNEYGVDIVQKSPSDIYIMSNGFDQTTEYHGYLLDYNSNMLLVSRVLSFGGTYGFGLKRFEAGYQAQWFLKALPSEAPTTLGAYRFTVAGMAASGCANQNYPSSLGNVNPILVDFEIAPPMASLYNPVTATALNAQVSLFETEQGTNNYNNYNSYTSMYFNPTFAAREDVESAIVMNAPRYEPLWGNLGLKIMHATYDNHLGVTGQYTSGTGNGANAGAPTPDVECGNVLCSRSFISSTVTSNNIIVTHPTVAVEAYYETTTEMTDLYGLSFGGDCNWSLGDTYKPTSAQILAAKTGKNVVYPNPATNELHVALAQSNGNTNVEVNLVNMYGQTVSQLYTGTAGTLGTTTLRLPDVAAGIYMVQIVSNGKMLHTEKLMIQQ